jgi:hypothetical protein
MQKQHLGERSLLMDAGSAIDGNRLRVFLFLTYPQKSGQENVMTTKDDTQTKALQKANWRAFRTWLKRHGKMILPIPGLAVLYAGYAPNDVREFRNLARKEDSLRRMWEIINDVESNARTYTGRSHLDTLHSVLKRIRGPLPEIYEATGSNAGATWDGQTIRKKYANMLDCADALASDDWQLLGAGERRLVWDMLSRRYVQNAGPDLQLWEGARKDMKQLDSSFIMIRTELLELSRKKDASPELLKTVEKMLKRYQDHYEKVGKSIDEHLRRVQQNLRKIEREGR